MAVFHRVACSHPFSYGEQRMLRGLPGNQEPGGIRGLRRGRQGTRGLHRGHQGTREHLLEPGTLLERRGSRGPQLAGGIGQPGDSRGLRGPEGSRGQRQGQRQGLEGRPQVQEDTRELLRGQGDSQGHRQGQEDTRELHQEPGDIRGLPREQDSLPEQAGTQGHHLEPEGSQGRLQEQGDSRVAQGTQAEPGIRVALDTPVEQDIRAGLGSHRVVAVGSVKNQSRSSDNSWL